MRILYVTPLWNGLRDIVIDGKEEANGMPAFFYPLLELKERGVVVDIIIGCDEIREAPKNINRLTLGDIFLYKFKPKKLHEKLKSPLSLLIHIIKHLNTQKYDFIYAHGSLGAIGVIAANLYKIPVGQRLYGTFMYSEIQKYGVFKTAIKHPLEYYSFKSKKKFLMITNDGTNGDKVVSLINKGKEDKYNFLFLNNGVNRTDNTFEYQSHNNQLFYAARVTRWKRQHLAVEMLAKLHNSGLKDLTLVFSGKIDDFEYKNEVLLLAEKLGLKDHVKFLGSLNSDQMKHNYNNSFAVLCMYEHSNLGNVFIEAYSSGSLIISLDEGSLSKYVNEKSGIVSNDLNTLVESVVYIYNNPSQRFEMKKHAFLRSKMFFPEWLDRAKLEADMIQKYIK